MQARLLEAALRVLVDDGALGFTTTRVAEEAGVSVGSLYQYFPNKYALATALHARAVEAGWRHVESILDDGELSPRQKIREIANWFFAIETDEAAQLGSVFDDLDVFLRDRHGADELETAAAARFAQLLARATNRRPSGHAVVFQTELLMTVLESVGKTVASRTLTHEQQGRWALATADMLCDHLGIA